jgi:hypothetical protein
MQPDKAIEIFLSQYTEDVFNTTIKLRKIIMDTLPGVIEQLDLPAKMIAYCYGQKYIDMICVIIPSKKEIKLSFYKGIELNDPHKILEGTAKFSRYIKIKSEEQINSAAIKQLLKNALAACKARVTKV